MSKSGEPIFSEEEKLRIDLANKEIENSRLKEKISHYESENSHLHEVIRQLNTMHFGPRSERWESEEQMRFFNEVEIESQKPEVESSPDGDTTEPTTEVSGHTRKRGKRSPLPKNLHRQIVPVELPESERFDEDGNPLKVIGKEISEKLKYEPAKVTVIEYHRFRYGRDSGDPVKTAPPLPSIIPKGIATPELLSAIIVSKYSDGLPLFRQEEALKRLDIDVSRSSMARWVVRSAEACRPLWNILQEKLMSSNYVACDETPVQVMNELGRKSTQKSWMWVRCNVKDDRKIVLFNYDPHRSMAVAEELFEGFKGFVQVDGFASYNFLEKKPETIRVGCNMHGRRKFFEAHKNGAKTGKTLAEFGLNSYKKLYEVEEKARGENLDFESRYHLRQELAVPVWRELKEWVDKKSKVTPPKSKIGKALSYFLNEYVHLTRYLDDGILEIDNGLVERMIKYFAIGRKAWLFSISESGAEASELFYSFMITMRINGVNPYNALVKIFEEIPKATTIEDFERIAEFILSPQG
jgi:transposase